MTQSQPENEVVLADDQSALAILHDVLCTTVARFPELQAAGVAADFREFRARYPDQLPRFESQRLGSAQRGAIAQFALQQLAGHLRWREPGREAMLSEALAIPAQPLPLCEQRFAPAAGWQASVTYRGDRYAGSELAALGAKLAQRHIVSSDCEPALAWLQSHTFDQHKLSLAGRKMVLLGANAEMAPTRHWLKAGADVLWIDMAPPPQEWLESNDFCGRLVWPAGNADLLRQPREILATIQAFADGQPVDLGLYAYAPGRARELRLTAVMNAMVDALPSSLVRSITLLVSPTTASALDERDLAAMRQLRETRPKWMGACARLGLFGTGPGYVEVAQGGPTARTVVDIQGGSYQAAQYLGKILTGECWAQQGFRVSANTAAITRTRSLAHPVFAAAFLGAAAFGVETMTPRQSRALNGLLSAHDLLHPDLPVPGTLRVHGGIHTLPYPLGSALRVAAAIGFVRSPRLLRGLLPR